MTTAARKTSALQLSSFLPLRIAMRLNAWNMQKQCSIRCRHCSAWGSMGQGLRRLALQPIPAEALCASSCCANSLTAKAVPQLNALHAIPLSWQSNLRWPNASERSCQGLPMFTTLNRASKNQNGCLCHVSAAKKSPALPPLAQEACVNFHFQGDLSGRARADGMAKNRCPLLLARFSPAGAAPLAPVLARTAGPSLRLCC